MKAILNTEKMKIDLVFPYSSKAVAMVKTVQGARFVPHDKGGPLWRCPLDLDTGRHLRSLFPDMSLDPGLVRWGRAERDRERSMYLASGIDDKPLADLALAEYLPDLAATLRPYQRADVAMLAELNMINGNEQGLGKTLETLGAIYEAKVDFGPKLVVAPATSLEPVWQYEIERWCTDRDQNIMILDGSTSKGVREAIREQLGSPDDFWLLTTAHWVRQGWAEHTKWAAVVLDEFHLMGLTNVTGNVDKGTAFAIAMKKVRSAKPPFLMSGTPIGGKPIRFWGALHFADRDKFSSKWKWADRWLTISEDYMGHKIIGGIKPGTEEEFYRAHAPYLLRRLKSEVLPDLPPKQYNDVWVKMRGAHKQQYKEFQKKAVVEIVGKTLTADILIAVFARLKIMATAHCGLSDKDKLLPDMSKSPKMAMVLQNMAETGILDPDSDAVTIVASHSARVCEAVAAYLNEQGIFTELITGNVTTKKRTDLIKRFQSGKNSPRCIVISTKAGGVAITLDRADTMHVLDEDWSPDPQLQLEDRIHRASRIHQVMIYYYRTRGTIDEYVHDLVQGKAVTNETILDLHRRLAKGYE